MNRVRLMVLVLAVAMVGSSQAALMNYYSAGPGNWNNPLVWTENLGGGWGGQWVPTAGDIAEIRDPGMVLNIAAGAVCQEFWGASPAWSIGNGIEVNVVSGGSLNVKTTAWGQKALIGYNGEIVFNVLAGGDVRVEAVGGVGGETVMGGELPGSNALLHIQGGDYVSDNSFMLNIHNLAGTAHVQIDGGKLETGYLEIGGGTIDITEGMLKLNMDLYSAIEGYVNAGKITGYGSGANVRWALDQGVTTVWAVPEPATMSLLAVGGLLLGRRKKA